jgi:hydroxyacylglutathione hydrolase
MVLDVRAPSEWDAGHIEGARNVPLGSLADAMASMHKDDPITVMCGSGYRSSIACSLLQRSGFHHVRNLAGGWTAWHTATSGAADV